MLELIYLDWDSTFFGFPVYKCNLNEQPDFDAINLLASQIQNSNSKLTYLFSLKKIDEVAFAKTGLSLKFVDHKITFSKKIETNFETQNDKLIFEFDSNVPTLEMVNLSIASAIHSRFKVDEQIGKENYEKLFTIWLQKSLNKEMADTTLVYYLEGLVVGMITLLQKKQVGQIGLLAVSEKARNKQVGSHLIRASEKFFSKLEVPEIQVVTQFKNEPACNFYQKNGFNALKNEYVYHIWKS